MLLSAELDIYVHHLMTASFLQDQWQVHKRYTSYTQVIDIISTRIYFGMWILKFFMLHDRNVKRKSAKRFKKNWRKWGKKALEMWWSPLCLQSKSMKKIYTRTLNKSYFQFDHYVMNILDSGTSHCSNYKVCVWIPILEIQSLYLLYCVMSLIICLLSLYYFDSSYYLKFWVIVKVSLIFDLKLYFSLVLFWDS